MGGIAREAELLAVVGFENDGHDVSLSVGVLFWVYEKANSPAL
jgi:hypothetical protein